MVRYNLVIEQKRRIAKGEFDNFPDNDMALDKILQDLKMAHHNLNPSGMDAEHFQLHPGWWAVIDHQEEFNVGDTLTITLGSKVHESKIIEIIHPNVNQEKRVEFGVYHEFDNWTIIFYEV